MANEPTFESARKRLTNALESQLKSVCDESGTRSGKRFAPRNLARNVFDGAHDRLDELYIAAQHLAHSTDLMTPVTHCSAAEFVSLLSINDDRSVQRIFAILLCIPMSLKLFQRFLSIFLPVARTIENGTKIKTEDSTDETTQNSLAETTGEWFKDTRLPISLATAIHHFDDDDGSRFYHKQFEWSPIILLENKRVEYVGDRRFCPLPRLSTEPLGSGAFGEVSKVELAEGSIENEARLSSQGCYAQKEFTLRESRHAFEDEWHVVREILRARTTHGNIMSPIAGLLQGDEGNMKFSMFFPVATCDLREYLTWKAKTPRLSASPYPPGGFEISDKKKIMFQAIGLVSALDHLHRGLDVEENQSLSCWHLDLKAQNVLVTVINEDNDMLFQISDFGISRIKRIRRADQVESERSYDATKLFQRNLSPSLTKARAGDGSECLAPEAYGIDSKVGASSDIWSLGCILSIVITFLEGGPNSVRTFEDYRKRDPYNKSQFFKETTWQQAAPSTYHDVGRGMFFQRKDTIDIFFKVLISQARQRDGEQRSVRDFLNVLLSKMLVADPTERAGAHDIHRLLKDVWQTYGKEQTEDTWASASQPRHPPHGLHPIAEHEYPGTRNDYADVLRRDARHRPEPHRLVGNAQQFEMIDSRSHWRNPLDKHGTPRGMSTTDRPTLRQPIKPEESIEALCALICDAARVGNVQMVRTRLDSLPPGIVAKNQDGRTPLSLAAENGATAVMEVLLRAGRLQTDGCDKSGRCALSWAAENGRLEAVEMLVQIGKANIDYKPDNDDFWTPLFWAASNGHVRIVRYLLQFKVVEIDGTDAYGRSPLSWACGKGFVDVVKELLSTNMVETKRVDFGGMTPSSRARAKGHNDIVKLLDSYERASRSLWRRLLKNTRIRKRPWSTK